MSLRLRRSLVLWLTLSVAGCRSGSGDGASDADAAAPAEPSDAGADAGSGADATRDGVFTAVTYNAGLAIVVRGVDERWAALPAALAALSADVLCLQELYAPATSPADAAERLRGDYPYSAMSEGDLSPSGSGLLLASRVPLLAPARHIYDEGDPLGFTDRLVLAADARIGERTVHVLCTHLYAGLGPADTAVRRAQTDELIQWSDAQGYLDETTLLLGDLNMGPDPIGACDPESDPPCALPDTETFEHLLTRFDDPAAGSGACTQCRDVFLPLQVLSLFDDEPDQRIDHCLTSPAADLAFRGARTVLGEDPMLEVGGQPIRSLSDHLGIECTFE